MEHAQALDRHAADLYLLGELNEADAEAFEEHFFECPTCADEVRVGTYFLDAGRAMVLSEKAAAAAAASNVVPIASRRPFNAWMPIAAAAMLVIAIGLPMLLSRGKAPWFEVGQGHSIDLSGSRGTEDDTVTVKDGQLGVLYADIPSERRYMRYEIRVLDSKGKVLFTRPVTPEEASNTLPLVFGELGAGSYVLVVVGTEPAGQQAEVVRTRFNVKRQGSTF